MDYNEQINYYLKATKTAQSTPVDYNSQIDSYLEQGIQRDRRNREADVLYESLQSSVKAEIDGIAPAYSGAYVSADNRANGARYTATAKSQLESIEQLSAYYYDMLVDPNAKKDSRLISDKIKSLSQLKEAIEGAVGVVRSKNDFSNQFADENDYNAWQEWSKRAEQSGVSSMTDEELSQKINGLVTEMDALKMEQATALDASVREEAVERMHQLEEEIDQYRYLQHYRKFASSPQSDVTQYKMMLEGTEAAEDYVRESGQLARETDKLVDKAVSFAEKNPVAGTVGSVLTTVFISPLAAIENADNYFSGEELDVHSSVNRILAQGQAMRGVVGEKIGESHGGTVQFLYETGMSLLDFGATMAVSGIAGPLSAPAALAMMSTQAGSASTLDALNRGLSDDQSFWYGVTMGAIEMLTEKIGLDHLMKLAKGTKGVVKALVGTLLQSGIEAGEEGLASIGGTIADVLIAQDKSYWEQSVKKHLESGKTQSEALRATFGETALNVLRDMAGGAISGGVTGGFSSALGYIANSDEKTTELKTVLNKMKSAYAARYGKEAPASLDENYRVLTSGGEIGLTAEQIKAFEDRTGIKATAEEFAQAGRELTADQAELEAAYAEREVGSVQYTPPTAKDIKAYSTADTEVYSKALSRTVYFYDGASHAQAEAGFAENGVVYINKNAPVNRNSVAVVLAHEYIHTIERTWNASANKYTDTAEYTELKDAVFQSKGYRTMLMSAGEGSHVSITHEEYLQQIINRYAKSGVTIDRAGAEKEAVAKYLSEYVFQSEQHLIELARANPTVFEKAWNAIRRFFARLAGRRPTDADLKKLESLFAKAAKAANKATQTQKSPATESGVQYMAGVTQEDINKYVEAAYNKENAEDYKKYAEASERLIADVSGDIDIKGYVHALRDNDIRHIRNSHGEQTNEKYPVTMEDITNIPYIVANYDMVFFKRNANGEPGLLYVKVGSDNVVYYVEAVTSQYHNEKLLVNKQMIKAGFGDIPNLAGFHDAINKKGGSSQYLADLQRIREAYVQDVKENYPTNSIPDSSQKNNPQFSLPSDTDYLDAVNRGDMETAQRMVDEAASAAGYTTDDSWRMNHTAPTAEDDTANSIDQIDTSYGGDGSVYSSHAVQYYGEGRGYDSKAIAVIRMARNNPDRMISVYRAVPLDVQDSRMRNGDWVSITREYAEEHGERILDGEYRIIENRVPAKHIYGDGNSIHEWGYDNGDRSEVYKNAVGNVKRLEITYDDDGELIPISKRFDENNPDPQYSLPTGELSTEVKPPKNKLNRKMSKSVYLEKMLSDPAVSEATKAQIRADKPLFEVMSDDERFALAEEIIRDEERVLAISAKLIAGEAITAEESTALILMQGYAAAGVEQANASYVTATAARLAGRALRSYNRHLKSYAAMDPEERRVALLADTKAEVTEEAFRLQNEFIDYKLHRGAGDFIDQVVIAFHAEKDPSKLSAEQLSKKVLKLIGGIEDVKHKDGAHIGEEVSDRVKGRLLKAFEDAELVGYLHEELKSGTAPIDAIRLAINKALRIKSMTNAEVKVVMGYAEEIGKLRDEWCDAADADAAHEIEIKMDALANEMFDYIAERMTISGFERVRAWRKTAMLANLRTHFRNTVSNIAMLPVQRGDQKIAALLEQTLFKKYGIADHTLATWSATAHGKQIAETVDKYVRYEMSAVSRYLGYATDTRTDGEADGEYRFEFNAQEIAMRRKMFGARDNALNRLSDFNSEWLEKEDAIFYKKAFRSALGQLMVAQQATEPTEAMIHNARQQAMEAVFKADGVVYRTAMGLKALTARIPADTIAGQRVRKVLDEAIDGVLPFTKTPANIAEAIFDHSVLGLTRTVVKHAWHKVRGTTGSLDMNRIIMQYAKGIQGSVWTIVGLALGLSGLLVTDEEDDWEYDELTGGTQYALKLGDIYISLDWLQPASSMFLIGATVGENLRDNNQGNRWMEAVSGVWEAAVYSLDFTLNQSYMTSLRELFSDVDDDQWGASTLGNMIKSYITQYIPTIVGQAARTVDPVQRKVTTDNYWQTLGNTIASRIPGLSYLLDPRVSVWGDDVMRNNVQDDFGGYLLNGVQQFALPSTITGREYPDDKTTEELIALYDRLKANGGGTGSIFNSNDMNEWVTSDGHLLEDNEDAYMQMDRYLRQAFKGAADRMVSSDAWDGWSDEEKAKQLGKMYTDIRKEAKEMLEEETVERTIGDMGDYADTLGASGDAFGNLDLMALKLSDGTFLVYNDYLADQYESAVQSRYDALWKDVRNKREYEFSLDGVKYTIDVPRASAEELALVERKTRERAEDHIKKLYKKADVAELEAALRSGDGHRAYEKLKSKLND